MSELLARVRSAFIADGAIRELPVARETVPTPAPHVGLVCDPALAATVGAGLALRLASVLGAPACVVCRWQPEPAPAPAGRPPARSAARRLAGRLAARELSVRAVGRVVLTALPVDPSTALVDAARALAAAGAAGAPTVVVTSGPRPAELDPLLAERDAIAVLTRPDAGPLAVAAELGAAELGPPVLACEYRVRPAERLLATAGIAAIGGLRGALEPVRQAVA